ncbi:glycosyltransferase family 4 protein [Haloquadratum walsbyi]|uniref:Probable glycosyltransferase, type 1 n=1 Tax=Haloquadratum walsbyi (strain DSM 16790 / HBSQ001) TaxID=362976 RepID=Q18EI7_HALWD|nr:glycosyltransferase family 4 protein [Haloquadratum walsbyi]CAJ53637.1 probable glycosyltransferase, type 1 [Haloquadratum walsbyi DSM 16790]
MNVAMVHYGESPHPAHQGFAEAIDADIISCSSEHTDLKLVSTGLEIVRGAQFEYDILVVEGSRPLISILAQGLIRKTKIIYLCADHFLYNLNHSTDSGLIKKHGINTLFQGIVDGVIAVSDFAAEFVHATGGTSIPMRIVHPYIQQDPFNEFKHISPDLSSKTAVTISSAPTGVVGEYKGVDLLVDSWNKVRRGFPDATLRVVGRGHPSRYENQPGVIVEGYVESISEVFQDASLYIQPSRVDAYPVTVLEALRASVPSVVTRTTGTRTEIRTIDPMLISDPNPRSIAEKIMYYFDKNINYKKRISRISHQRGGQYSPKKWKSAFESAFESLLEEINE